MSSNTNLEVAYWSVVRKLEPAAGIPASRLEAAWPEFVASVNSGRPGEPIYRHLRGVAWDWPAWPRFAHKAAYATLEDISKSIAAMSSSAVLLSCSAIELRQLCETNAVAMNRRATKAQIVSGILDALGSRAESEVARIRASMLSSKMDACRENMAKFVGVRIARLAYGADRYDQLGSFPSWQFSWCGHIEADAPRSCRKFDGTVKPTSQARSTYPVLPCKYLLCSCYITGVGIPG